MRDPGAKNLLMLIPIVIELWEPGVLASMED